jgi:ADP-heptose:LPS heptosyltransferase
MIVCREYEVFPSMADLAPLLRKDKGFAGAVRWKLNHWLTRRPWLLHLLSARMTVFDVFGAPGDTLLTAIVCRHLHERFPRIRINCLTANPELLQLDPNIDTLNEPESYICLWHSYLDLIERKDRDKNVLRPTFDHLAIRNYEYRGQIFLSDDERANAKRRLGEPERPVLAFNTKSKEPVKNWPFDCWIALLNQLRGHFTLLHLGDDKEPEITGVQRLAGLLTMRESMALLSHARLFVGPDSFLMHAANGLNVPSVIIFGGSRPPEAVGYSGNVNLFVEMPCGPCWIHANRGEQCNFDLSCLRKISIDEVYDSVVRLWTEMGDV